MTDKPRHDPPEYLSSLRSKGRESFKTLCDKICREHPTAESPDDPSLPCSALAYGLDLLCKHDLRWQSEITGKEVTLNLRSLDSYESALSGFGLDQVKLTNISRVAQVLSMEINSARSRSLSCLQIAD